ncbi:MAG TPA: permease [Gammaproteobacteria bacterium]|nr:permease [Gammaproteobacteria bacterium]
MPTRILAQPLPTCGCPPRAAAGPLRRALHAIVRRTDAPLVAIAVVLLLLALLAPAQLATSLLFTGGALLGISPWLAISVGCAAFARASGLDRLVARAFTGSPARMIVLAALFGALSPFCSCGVIPVIAGLLAAGVPLAPVMAFWLSSPLMDPNMFALTAATLGLEFAFAKALAAIAIGLFSGAVTHGLVARGYLRETLRIPFDGGTASVAAAGPVRWNVLADATSRRTFTHNAVATAWFLLRWMAFAFVLESLMVAWLPPETVVAVLGGEAMAIPLAVLVGVPAYLNGFAALPLVGGLVELGMQPAVGLAFLVAGGIASIPAAAAVWALARPPVFALYLGLGVAGSLLAAYAYSLLNPGVTP